VKGTLGVIQDSMLTILDKKAFANAHGAFLAFMAQRSGGIPFTSFDHPFFVDDEISYKQDAARDGRHALQIDSWESWRNKTGKILAALKAACSPQVSRNLMEHRYGAEGNSYSPLYRVSTRTEIADLEFEFDHFFRGGSPERNELGPRFDRLATYLREHGLGCKWPFLAYLAFLLDSRKYFPILPGRFEELLRFYGSDARISGRVEWDRYLAILDMADLLKQELSQYGTPTAIVVQSYMWVVGSLVKQGLPDRLQMDYEHCRQDELATRQKRAAERERIGLLGEWHVYDAERQKLGAAQLDHLVAKVLHISQIDDSLGFDVLSFDESGAELHIEVKTTQRDSITDFGFWLSANEHAKALEDPYWCIYRVWAIDTAPHHENLGNVVMHGEGRWRIKAASWFVGPDSTDV